jgi:hypothetical protein
MKRAIKLLWLILLGSSYCGAQVTFNHFYDFDALMGPANYKSMIVTADGGFAIVGSVYHTPWSEFDPQGNEILNYTNDILLVKTDSAFNVQWTKIYYSVIDFSYEESGVKIKEKPNGGFILLTETEDPQGIYYTGKPANLISTNATGNMLWSYSFSATTGYDKPFDFIIDDTDNSIVVAGSSNFGANSRKPWAFKTDSSGHLLWGNTYTATNGEFRSILKVPSGGYLLAGKRGTDVMMMRMTSNGTNIWTRTYITSASEGAQTVIRSGTGYALLVNNITVGSCQLLQTDSGGVITSVKSYLQFTGISLIRNGNTFLITGNQGSSAIQSFTTDLTGTITGNIRKYSIPSFIVGSNESLLKGNQQYICGYAANNAWMINCNLTNGFSGGCNNSITTITTQTASFTFATISPGVNNLFMEGDIQALMVDETIYINQYIICSCSPANAQILNVSPVKVCFGDMVTLKAQTGNTYQYQWFVDNDSLPFENNDSLVTSVDGNYTVIVTSNCGADTSSVAVVEYDFPPAIDSVSVTLAGFGESIVVYGNGLDDVTSATIGASCSVFPFTDDSLVVIVSQEATDNTLNLINSTGCQLTGPFISILPPLTLKLNLFIEGLYLTGGETKEDTVIVSLYTDASTPVQVYNGASVLAETGQILLDLPIPFQGQSLFVAVRHRNSLETWSATPILIEDLTVLNFSTNSNRPEQKIFLPAAY